MSEVAMTENNNSIIGKLRSERNNPRRLSQTRPESQTRSNRCKSPSAETRSKNEDEGASKSRRSCLSQRLALLQTTRSALKVTPSVFGRTFNQARHLSLSPPRRLSTIAWKKA